EVALPVTLSSKTAEISKVIDPKPEFIVAEPEPDSFIINKSIKSESNNFMKLIVEKNGRQ
ncbi:15378_t:CDS:1, partial [Funneliformis geosporum]